MRWMSSKLDALFQAKCVCASTRQGISVAPAPSMTVRPAVPAGDDPRETRAMRLPWTSTSPE